MSFGRYFLGSVAVAALLMTAVSAKARSINSQMQNLKAQIEQLNRQLQNLQSQVRQTQQKQAKIDATVSQIKAVPAPAQTPTGVPYLTMKGLSPTFSSADGANTLLLTGRFLGLKRRSRAYSAAVSIRSIASSTWREKTYCAGRCLSRSISGVISPSVLTPRSAMPSALSGCFTASTTAVAS